MTNNNHTEGLPTAENITNLVQKYQKRRQSAISRFLIYFLVTALAAAAIWLLLPNRHNIPIIVLIALGGILGATGVTAMTKAAAIIRNSILIAKLKTSPPQYIYELGNGLAFAEARDMQECEEMAANGYLLQAVNAWGFYKFARSEPASYDYSVDYADIKAANKDFAPYCEIFAGGGWEYVCSNDKLHWFKAPKGTTPIYTDDASLAQKMAKMRRLSALTSLVFLAIAAVCVILNRIIANEILNILLSVIGGGSLGGGLVMLWAAILNHRRVLQLKKQQKD